MASALRSPNRLRPRMRVSRASATQSRRTVTKLTGKLDRKLGRKIRLRREKREFMLNGPGTQRDRKEEKRDVKVDTGTRIDHR